MAAGFRGGQDGRMGGWKIAALLLTLSRIPMAGLVWIDPASPPLVLGLMAAAGLTDVLDGWAARRGGSRGGPRDVGAWLDPLCDKAFILSVVAALAVVHRPPLAFFPLVAAREILQVPMLLLVAKKPSFDFRAAVIGKAATVAQFAAVAALMLKPEWAMGAAAAAGALGVAAAVHYASRLRSGANSR